MKIINRIQMSIWGFCLFICFSMWGQQRPSVLKLTNNADYTTYFDTKTRFSTDVIPAGTQGEGTLEFWAMSGSNNTNTVFSTWKLTNLLTGNQSFAFEVNRTLLRVKIGQNTVDINLNANKTILNNQWNHYALAVNTANQLSIYKNGELLQVIPNITISGNLYITKAKENQLIVAEYRVWNKERTTAQINDLRFRTLFNESATSLADFKNIGLVIAYGNNLATEREITKVENLSQIYWTNIVGSSNQYNEKSRITSQINTAGVRLAEIVTDADHPILTLSSILLQVADGGGIDMNLDNDRKGIVMKWPHIRNAASYTIKRKAVQGGDTPSLIHTIANVAQIQISENIIYFDTTVQPGELYEYTVTAIDANNNPISTGQDTGFVFHNGEMTGRVITPTQNGVPNVKLEAILESNGQAIAQPGKSLLFNPGAPAISISDIQEAKKTIGNSTLEFWYKTPTAGTGTNSIFKLGPAEIRINNTSAGIYVDNNLYLAANKPNDNLWHHYSFVINSQGTSIYVDGGNLPTGVETQITPTAFNATPFFANLNGVNTIYINQSVTNAYLLDEFRIWNTAKSAEQIFNYKDVVLGNTNDINLLLYYRFDINGAYEIYSQGAKTESRFTGKSCTFSTVNGQLITNNVNLTTSTDIPNIKFAVFTDSNGNYEFNALPGLNGVATLGYQFKPVLPNHLFSPENRFKQVPVALLFTDAQRSLEQFIDTSTFTVTGEVVYKVADSNAPGGFYKYPALSNTRILMDGLTINKPDGSQVSTLSNGTFQLSAPLGRHTFSIDENVPSNGGTNSTQSSFNDLKSLSFDGKSYAETKEIVNSNINQQFTFSAFFKPKINVIPNGTIPTIQTLLHWGDLVVNLQANKRIHVLLKGVEIVQRTIETKGGYNFFGLTFNKSGNQIALLIDSDYVVLPIPSGNFSFSSKIYVGAERNSSGLFANHSVSNIDNIEYRDASYSKERIVDIRDGKENIEDVTHLQLLYSFEQDLKSRRAINMIVKTNTNENNYLIFQEGTGITNNSSSSLNRMRKFKYIASNGDYNPTPNTNLYQLNLTDPLSSVNFENTTRYHFIGNIIVPCDNQVGVWTGTIKRTDVNEPLFQKEITSSNFSSDNKVFTVKDLLPGVYEVALTNVVSGKAINSFSVDLRNGNTVKDIFYSNALQHEVTFYNYNSVTKVVGTQIMPLCNGKYVFTGGNFVAAFVKTVENYGNNSCPIDDVSVSFSGDLGLGTGNSSSPIVSKTDKNGFTFLAFQINNPNFLGDYTRKLNIAMQRGTGSNLEGLNAVVTAYVEGARPGNNDFTITNPNIGFVLHDPPGDGSYATLEQGSNFTHEYNFEAGTDIQLVVNNEFGIETEQKFQVLALAAPGGVGAATGTIVGGVEFTSGAFISQAGNLSYRQLGGDATNVTLRTSISTPSFDTYVGQDADTFIGTSDVLLFSNGQSLNIDRNSCVPSVSNKITMEVKEKIPFVFTQQQIKDVTIPNLQRLLIAHVDGVNPPNPTELAMRSSLELDKTITRIVTQSLKDTDNIVKNYIHQIDNWNKIIERNTNKLKSVNFIAEGKLLSATTNEATINQSNSPIAGLDQGLSFSGGVNVAYNLERNTATTTGSQLGGSSVTTAGINFETEIFGIVGRLNTSLSVSGVRNNTTTTTNSTNRIDSFVFSDATDGDQFNVTIRRDPEYDTPMFLTNGGRSMCPYEAGTVPREGVELVVDKTVGYGTGAESILYNLTLRNTQLSPDATRKTYIVAMDGASNSSGAQVFLNESPIFEPGTASPIVFTLDGSSPTGVKQEVQAQLKIGRGLDAPDNISYENIGIRIYSLCENNGDAFRRYRTDEFATVRVVPFYEINVTAHFSGKCVDAIEQALPLQNWTVNNSSNNLLPVRFKIPELNDLLGAAPVNGQPETSTFQIVLEYATEGTNTPVELITLDAATLRAHLESNTGFVVYNANVSALADGNYSFRITPVCDPLSNNPNARSNSTTFVAGSINRSPAVVIATNPVANGVLTAGTISATFNKAINPATVNLNSVGLRGVIGGLPKDLVSAELAQHADEIVIPHQPIFNLSNAFTIEMWINPSTFPTAGSSVPILQKGNNYKVELNSNGTIKVNDIVASTKAIQPFTWTHVAIVYDGSSAIQVYFNGEEVSSGQYNGLATNNESIVISKDTNGQSYIGKLDDIRIWKKARTAIEIISGYKKQLLGNETDLLAYFVMDNIALQGTNGLPNEAIRDYTGNARGTTATGLSFVTGETNAAPMDVSKMVKDLQFTTTVSNGNTVINISPLFTVADLEGAKLTAIFNHNQLRDQSGNQLNGHSWDFIINQNTIAWSQNNVSRVQIQGNELVIDDINLVNETGGIPVRYRFANLPVWLTVQHRSGSIRTPITQGVNRTVQALQTESNLEFVVAPFLNSGVHSTNVNIIVENATTGIPLGIESFALEINTQCEVPNYTVGFDSGNYIGSSNFVGKLIIDNIQTLDTNDKVAIYINDIYRGGGTVGLDGRVRFGVFGESIDDNTELKFKVWDASTCTEYDGIIENYRFKLNSNMGSNTIPLTFTVGNRLSHNIPVRGLNYEVSFNLEDTSGTYMISLDAIKGLSLNDEIRDAINTSTILAVANAQGKLIKTNSLTESRLDVTKSYLVKRAISTPIILKISGIPVVLNKNILVSGNTVRNGIAFFPNELQRVSYALRSLTSTTVSSGDIISRRGLSTEYDATNGWVGSLTHLTPGLGYEYTGTNTGILNYSGIASSSTQKTSVNAKGSIDVKNAEIRGENEEIDLSYLEKATKIGWKVETGDYLDFMYVTAVVNGYPLDDTQEYVIAGFVDNQIRGIAKPQLIDGKYHYFMGIGSNDYGKVTFKIYDGHKIYTLDNYINFDASYVIGNLKKPYILTFTPKDSEEVFEGYVLGQNYPNPMNSKTEFTFGVPYDSYVEIQLYNYLGQKVHTFVNNNVKGNQLHVVEWDGITSNGSLTSGVYIYEMTCGDKKIQHRLIIE